VKYWPLIWRNLTRNKLRTALTGGAIALAISLICLLLTMPAGFDRLLEAASANTRVGVHAKAGLVYALPVSYLNKVRSMPGVVAATPYDWFGGALDVEKGVTFPNFSVDPEVLGTVYADYGFPPEVLEEFRRNRDAALVATPLLARHGWKIGDRVTLYSTRYGFPLDFRIVGEINPPRGRSGNPMVWFQREYLEQALEARGEPADEMSMVWARVEDPARIEPLMREIDEFFRNSEVQTASETEKSFVANFFGVLKGMVTIIMIVTGLVSLCIVFIAANTASMSVRERMRELAIYKALGFSRRAIFATLLAEAVLLSAVAGAAGAAVSLGLAIVVRSIAEAGGPLAPLSGFVVGPTILVQGLFLALFVGMLSGVVPSIGAARRGVVATLREVF
jgi:putative ABC transport system permease protein